jgi:hypothetical protein
LSATPSGEFLARDLSLRAVDQQHVHVFNPTLEAARVSFKGHVVSSKKGAERNQTSHEIVGEKDWNNDWTVEATVGKQAEGGAPVPELCREHGISNATFYKWRSKFGGMDAYLTCRIT